MIEVFGVTFEAWGLVFVAFFGFIIFAFVVTRVGSIGAKRVKPLGSTFHQYVRSYDREYIRQHMTARTTAKVLGREIVKKTSNRRFHHKNHKHDFYEYKEYEYTVDGVKYLCYGEDPGFLWRNKTMPICYNPQNPGESVTVDYCKYTLKI